MTASSTRPAFPAAPSRCGSRDGERLWEQNVGSASTPAVSGNAIFIVDLQDNLVAHEPDDRRGVLADGAAGRAQEEILLGLGGADARRRRALGGLERPPHDRRRSGTGNIVVDRELPSPAYIKPIAAGGQLLVLSADGSLAAFQ